MYFWYALLLRATLNKLQWMLSSRIAALNVNKKGLKSRATCFFSLWFRPLLPNCGGTILTHFSFLLARHPPYAPPALLYDCPRERLCVCVRARRQARRGSKENGRCSTFCCSVISVWLTYWLAFESSGSAEPSRPGSNQRPDKQALTWQREGGKTRLGKEREDRVDDRQTFWKDVWTLSHESATEGVK